MMQNALTMVVLTVNISLNETIVKSLLLDENDNRGTGIQLI